PEIAAEGAAGQLVFERVVEEAEAAAHLPLAVALQVPGEAGAGSDLVAPAEGDGVGHLGAVDLRLEGRQELVLDAHAQVEGQPPSGPPRVLEIEGLVAA